MAGSQSPDGGSSAGEGGTAAATQPSDARELRSELARLTDPDVSPTELTELALGNRRFAVELYQHLASEYEGENLFFSPYSVSSALAMTFAGAENNTETQMAATLHFTLPEDALHAAFNLESQQLNSRGQDAAGADGEGFRLNVVNSIWGQDGYPFLQSFLDCLALNYGAGLRVVDFINVPESCRVTINDWVAEQTEDRIQDLLPPGSITGLTRMVLVNAVYFNAAWLHPFEVSATQPGDFNLLDGSAVQTDMMQQTELFGYLDGENFTALELHYDGGEMSMVIIVPDSGQYAAFESGLTLEKLDAIISALGPQRVELSMPGWTFQTGSISLSGILRQMGMQDPFDSLKADFSAMADAPGPLFISDVVHKAFVAVDEEGTEAAAATGVIIVPTSVPPPPIPFAIDRPFVYLIRDIATETIVFMGRVTDPR